MMRDRSRSMEQPLNDGEGPSTWTSLISFRPPSAVHLPAGDDGSSLILSPPLGNSSSQRFASAVPSGYSA